MGTEAKIPKIRERARGLEWSRRGEAESASGVASPLPSMLEAVTRHGAICEDKKTVREKKRTSQKTERRTPSLWLGLSSIDRARVDSTQTRRGEGKWDRYCLLLVGPGGGKFIRDFKAVGKIMPRAK